jgi:hypothetical protein
MENVYYHTCGYPIAFETREIDGETVPVFLDGAPRGGEEPEATAECPGCGETLLLGDLLNELEDE